MTTKIAHRPLRRAPEPRPVAAQRLPDPCVPLVDVHPGVPVGVAGTNPAQWAEPPAIPNDAPVVPTPEEVRALIDAAEQSKRPEYARAILVAATTGLRRAELCGLRVRDVDFEHGVLDVSAP